MMARRGLNPEPQRMTVIDGFIWAFVVTVAFVVVLEAWQIGHVVYRDADCQSACAPDDSPVAFVLPWQPTDCHCWPVRGTLMHVVRLEGR